MATRHRGPWRWSHATRLMTAAASCLALFVAAPGVSHAAGDINPSQLFDVSCPSVTQCTGLGEAAEFTFNPQETGTIVPVSIAPAVPLVPPFLTRIDCPSTHQCTAAGWKGTEITFDPTRPGTLTAPAIAPESFLSDWLSCPSVSQCTAISATTPAYGLTFNPQAAQMLLLFPLSTSTQSIACPSASECVTLDKAGNEATFNPAAPGTPIPYSLSVEGRVPSGRLTCVSEHQCTASGEYEVTFDPVGPGAAPHIIASGSLPGVGPVACPTGTQCTELRDNYGAGAATALTFDPLIPPTPRPMSIGTHFISGLSCPSINQCTAVDLYGRETTFDPNTPTRPVVPVVIDRLTGKLANVTKAVVSGSGVTVDVRCTGFYGSCTVTLQLLVHETLRGGTLIAVGAGSPASNRGRQLTVRTLTLAHASVAVLSSPEAIRLDLNATGRRLLAARHKLTVSLVLTQAGSPPMRQPLLFVARPQR